ncbi:MAG: winged helix-turn-helix domain-containing protein [Verrucomicrobiota bacterium]
MRNQETVKVEALENGVDDYVTKPFGSAEGLRVHINHLRKKLGTRGIRIINEPGIGYRLENSEK